MAESILHITNGNALTDYLKELEFTDPMLTWQEMLCEGPTIPAIDSEEFFALRADFLKAEYAIEVDHSERKKELSKLDAIEGYSEINLWFEYDLFCHMNLVGVINLLHQREVKKPLYLICSGRVEGEKNLKGLSELAPAQLKAHYQNKVRLTQEDIDLAVAVWRTYCGKDHNILKPYIVTASNFEYLSSCLKAHLERFPNQKNGLDVLETNMLKLIKENEIKSVHHLLGYALNYQGYYGYGDLQLERIISNLSLFYQVNDDRLILNREGHEALFEQQNFADAVNNDIVYGGVKRLNFQFSEKENKLIKNIPNAN